MSSLNEAVNLVEQGEPSLVLAMISPDDEPTRLFDLVVACTKTERPVPVVVVSETYDESHALALFGMGVADYLSLADHQDRIVPIVATLMTRDEVLEPSPRPEPAPRIGAGKTPRVRQVTPIS